MRAVVAAVVLVIIGSVGTATAVGTGELRSTNDIDVDDIRLTLTVDESGDAAWVVEHRSRLDSPERQDAFDAFLVNLEEDPAQYREPFERNMAETIAIAADATDRDMVLSGVSISAERVFLPQEYGIIRYEFTWTGFAHHEDGSVVIGDAVGGMFLDESATLRINWPPNHEVSSVSPPPTVSHESGVTWVGPVDFTLEEPHITLTTDTTPLPSASLPLVLIVLAVFLLTSVAVGYTLSRRSRTPTQNESVLRDRVLLTNEEQVLTVLEANDGRMKQQEIVSALGWSETKTSDVVTEMERDGAVERFRLGRENIVSLPPDETDT